MFFKIGVLKNFGIFTGKQLCWSLFLVKLQALALFRMGLFGAAHRYGDKMVPLLLLHISYNDETWQLYLPLPCFCCSSCWPYTHICLQSYLVNLEQVTNHYDCLEEVSVPFLPTVHTGKVGNWIRVNNLRLGADYSFTHNRDCLVYTFSLRFSGRKFLINLRWQFRVRKIFSCT